MTCKHCGKPIYSTGAIWLHRDGHLTQCTLPTYAEPAKPAAIRCALCTWQWLGDGGTTQHARHLAKDHPDRGAVMTLTIVPVEYSTAPPCIARTLWEAP